jgi:hypothetical protein
MNGVDLFQSLFIFMLWIFHNGENMILLNQKAILCGDVDEYRFL